MRERERVSEKKNKKKQGKGSYLPSYLLALYLISPRLIETRRPWQTLG